VPHFANVQVGPNVLSRMMSKSSALAFAAVVAAVAAGCSGAPATSGSTSSLSTSALPCPPAPAASFLTFEDKVWELNESEDVVYRVFLGGGHLIIGSVRKGFAVGDWSYENGELLIVENRLLYTATIVELTSDTFTIRTPAPHGKPEDSTFHLAKGTPLDGGWPPAAKK
jgi:hypothetical protein